MLRKKFDLFLGLKNNKGFTLIELLVVIAIIGVLATLAVVALQQARSRARDSKRLADVKQIQTALELFYNDNNRYPTIAEWNTGSIVSSSSDDVFMIQIPTAPTPADGDCSESENNYVYSPNAELSDYSLSFCISRSSANFPDSTLIAFSGGIRSSEAEEGGDENEKTIALLMLLVVLG